MVDIIVPIYNAYDAVTECLNSIVKNTDLKQNRLILINDKSTDDRVLPFLYSFKEKYSDLNIIVLENDINLGFVGTVNKGMKYSNNDVVLLNSDTEVPKNWIENLNECAYSSLDVATATALSNNATLASVPKGLTPNKLPEGYTFDEYSEIVEKISFKIYPEIPTAHGFCMYIKRFVLDEVGYFDEETFGKGYGEENDFSYRCIEYGFKHLLCDNVIVYHKESQSFNEKRDELIKQHMEVLKKRYPKQFKNTAEWCTEFPIENICNNVLFNVESQNRVNILFLIHDWSDIKKNVGGTTLHCKDIIYKLRVKYNFFVLAPEKQTYVLYSYFGDTEKRIELSFLNNIDLHSFYNKNYRNMLSILIDALDIKVVHVHHMINHYFDIIDVCKDKNVKSIITLHDFYCLCPTVNLLYNAKEYCLDLKEKNCANCLNKLKEIQNDIIPVWRKFWNNFLCQFDFVITPSESTKRIVESRMKNLNCTVIEHGIDLVQKEASQRNGGEFNVAFVGIMATHKGANVLKYLIKNSKNIKYHLFGDSDYQELKHNYRNYIYHGRYKREQLPELLKQNNIHLVCNFSIWPETYSYTLTETIACGIPVISYDLGAVSERIKKYGFGWVLEDRNLYSTLNMIEEIRDNVDEYNKKIECINSYKIRTVDEMVNFYDDLYQNSTVSLIKKDKFYQLLEMEQITKQIKKLDSETKLLINSRRWRLMKRIRIPGFIRKIARIVRKFV